LPLQFDASIIVDASAETLFEVSKKSGVYARLATKPCIVLDHHTNDCDIHFATHVYNRQVVAAGQLVDDIARALDVTLDVETMQLIAIAILSDSLGLTSESTDATVLRLLGDYVENGLSLASIDNMRRETYRKSERIVRYKGELLSRVQYWADGELASIIIPWREIEKYSYEYNPSMLVIDDMRQTIGANIAVALKVYPDRITAKLRSNFGVRICDKIAAEFGGGGHPYAAGFKVLGKGLSSDKILNDIIVAYMRHSIEAKDEAIQ
jgi:bifunctional oligoribonuclease and PAP phosphatase NrnA